MVSECDEDGEEEWNQQENQRPIYPFLGTKEVTILINDMPQKGDDEA